MNYIRTKFSGNKKRFIDEKFNLDLSYITNRIIAMAFPAIGIEKIYKNSINSVSKFLNEKHNAKYFVFNLSGKKYANHLFENRVYEIDWHDYNLKTLFFICQSIHKFLYERIENVAVIHCDAGLGRTIVIICCYLLYCGRFTTAESALEYYNKKRLAVGEANIQPHQKRYIFYFEQMMKEKIYFPYLISIVDISFNKYPLRKVDAIRPFIEIWQDEKLLSSNKTSYAEQRKLHSKTNPDFLSINDTNFKVYCCGDITIKCSNNNMLTTKKLGMVTLNTSFFEDDQREIVVRLSEIDPEKLRKNKKIPKDFEIKIKFVRLCECKNRVFPVSTCEVCTKFVEKHLQSYQEIHNLLENHKPSSDTGRTFLFGDPTEDDVDVVLKSDKDEIDFKKTESKEDLNSSFEGDCLIF